RAMYLAYWEAKLNNKDFSEELIMNSQLFNDFFGEYQNRIADAFGNYVQDLAAYLFGIDIQLEGIPNELESLRKSIISNYEYTPVYNGEELETIKLITDNQEVVETISSIIKDAETSASDYDPETLIMRTRSSIFRSSFSLIAGLKSVISEEFVVVTPKQVNLGWIRWVVYVVFLLVWYMLFKNFKLPLTLIIASETVYIGAFFNIQSTVDGMIYGIVFAISILFSLSYFLLKKKYVPALFSLFAIVSLFLPAFATEDLLMKNEFSNSLFYPVLLEETLNDPLGKVQNSLKEYDSLINESIQSFSTVVNDVFQGEFYEIPEEYFVPENFSKRIEYVNGLKSTHKDFAKELDNFVYYENSRAKKAEKQIQSIEKLFTKFASIASDSFKDEMVAFVNSRFSGKTLERLLSTLNSAKRSSVVWVPGYKVGTFLSAIMLLGFALFLSALNMYEAFIPMLGSFAVSVLTLLRNQTLFVQVGVPSLTIYVNWYIPYALILSIGFGLYWLYHNHILKRRSRV
ncbi:MAG TPA: hypothetical protein P5156_07210, partial [Fervidobacterium sp.]|nr:hypothetical protein [Fervidobacterium sp.]